MKKGISIWSFAEKDLKKCMELAKDAGFEFDVEFARIENGEAVKCATGEVKSENNLKAEDTTV